MDWKDALKALGAAEDEGSLAKVPTDDKTAVKRNKRTGVVYSTASDFVYSDGEEESIDTLPKNQQKLRLQKEKAGRGGKTVTLVKGFVGSDDDCEALCKLLKKKCGVGGSVKEGEIIIQGDLHDKLCVILKSEGYSQTR